jgi:hypothetical protein
MGFSLRRWIFMVYRTIWQYIRVNLATGKNQSFNYKEFGACVLDIRFGLIHPNLKKETIRICSTTLKKIPLFTINWWYSFITFTLTHQKIFSKPWVIRA